jgi:hypothetical protein
MELLYQELKSTTNNVYAKHRINFGEIAANFGAAGYGFGVERVEIAKGLIAGKKPGEIIAAAGGTVNVKSEVG